MFVGEYEHSIDYKGRVSVPKKFREALGREPVLTRGLDGCLFLYSRNSWEELAKKMVALPLTQADARAFSRYLFAGAVEVDFDKLGRISLPEYLRKYAALKKEAIVIGVLERIEVWDKNKWKKMEAKLRAGGEALAERLRDSGI
ncbi:MAG: division/cell wall cluster transcriptional repressor MraZ [bacterium]|nr:division/cell wall cluster transcriptional repressor MraZ [bacterium]